MDINIFKDNPDISSIMETPQKIYGWYSQQQLNNIIGKFSKPYIYYKDIYGNIVQITEVKNNRICKSNFPDAYSLGELQEFHASDGKPMVFDNSRYISSPVEPTSVADEI